MSQVSRHIHIIGIVQGVGFRPFVYNLAHVHHLTGWVRNSANGVDIEVTGTEENLNAFTSDIIQAAPPLAQIDSMESAEINQQLFDGFHILSSDNKASDFIPVSPDMAICQQCKDELFNNEDRRYRYPFINCTNCGPRFTIIKDIPYDRPMTTMADFEMCPECLKEYKNPLDRRFHAQPIACPVCGPQVWLEIHPGETHSHKDSAIQKARHLLANGKILAIKGLGGFHLACDATDQQAVARLRERKGRSAKPFALMTFNLETMREFVYIGENEEKLLTSPQMPIVLLPKKANNSLADAIAPGQSTFGFLLPYTPLHLLLCEPEIGYPKALVMTSGNLSEEPILFTSQAAREKLGTIADAFLMHDRPIFRRTDDSVFSVINNTPYPIRRARGYAPNPIRLTEPIPQILAVGPQMKNTFCLTREKYAFTSHHIGEMENWMTYQDYQSSIKHFESLFRIQPEAIGYDLHPDYVTTKYALERSTSEQLPRYPIQHHHAHLASVLIENRLPPLLNVAGLIFDGTGYGQDGTIWGGEILLGNCLDFTRLYHLKPVPLPGGEVSINKPARMALSTLWAYDIPWKDNIAPMQHLSTTELEALNTQLERTINTPLTSSIGRLFDAVSALIGVRESISYEAQAAIELEALADRTELGYYPWQMDGNQIDIKPMLEAILSDLSRNLTIPIIAAHFHNSIAQMSLEIATLIRQNYDIHQIALSGGVWQNQLLLKRTLTLFENNKIKPLIHRQLPPNDGCVALGQALVTAYRYLNDKE